MTANSNRRAKRLKRHVARVTKALEGWEVGDRCRIKHDAPLRKAYGIPRAPLHGMISFVSPRIVLYPQVGNINTDCAVQVNGWFRFGQTAYVRFSDLDPEVPV